MKEFKTKAKIFDITQKQYKEVEIETVYRTAEKIAEDYFKKKGFEVYNIDTVKSVKLPDPLVPKELKEKIESDYNGDPFVAGMPDLLCYKSDILDYYKFVEVKSRNDGLSIPQLEWISKSNGITVQVIAIEI